jgi:hypothetical protein
MTAYEGNDEGILEEERGSTEAKAKKRGAAGRPIASKPAESAVRWLCTTARSKSRRRGNDRQGPRR